MSRRLSYHAALALVAQGVDLAAELEAEAEELDRRPRSSDSFVTDSIRAGNADRLRGQASVIRAGFRAEFVGLFASDGSRIPAKLGEGRFGPVWILRDDAARFYGRRLIPPGARSRIQRQLGMFEAKEVAPAWVDFPETKQKGTISNVCAVRPVVLRVGDPWGRDFEGED
jgi:hypothetical protein